MSNLENMAITLCLIGGRTAGMVGFAPLFGHSAIPMRVKAALAIAIVMLLYPSFPARTLAYGQNHWVLCLASELLIGTVTGLVVNLVFDGVQLAGQIAATQFGFSLVNIIDPQTQVDTPVLSVFHQLVAMLIFLQLEVHHWLLRGLGHSFEYLPLGSVLNPTSLEQLWKTSEAVWFVGLQIAAPVLVATVFTDMMLGLLSKASPQFPALLFGISLKILVGLLALSSAIYYWPTLFERLFGTAVATGERILHLAK